jgi:hypothetical protein
MELIAKLAVGAILVVVLVMIFGAYFNGLDKGAKVIAENQFVQNATAESTKVISNKTIDSVTGLINKVKTVNATSEVQSNLISPLNQAQNTLSRNLANSDQAVCANLQSFRSNAHWDALNGKLDSGISKSLDGLAEKIESGLDCKSN